MVCSIGGGRVASPAVITSPDWQVPEDVEELAWVCWWVTAVAGIGLDERDLAPVNSVEHIGPGVLWLPDGAHSASSGADQFQPAGVFISALLVVGEGRRGGRRRIESGDYLIP